MASDNKPKRQKSAVTADEVEKMDGEDGSMQINPSHIPVSVVLNTQSGATVIAPVLTGNHIQGSAVFNFSPPTGAAVQQPLQEDKRNAPVPVEPQPIQSDGKRRNMTQSSQEFKHKKLQEMGDEIYRPASSQRKGSALLITNIVFDYKEYNRYGAEIDEENMKWLLEALGYSVVKRRNLSGEEIDREVRNFSNLPEHRDSDSIFVVIMSHGSRINNRDAISGVRYHEKKNPKDVYFVDKTFSHLNSKNCLALIDKPKVILILACRGGHPGGVEVRDQVPDSDSWVHREKDFVCFMSTLPDTASYRNTKTGSHFINYIVEVFCELAHKHHIMELFTKVTSDMASRPGRTDDKLLPCLERTSLTKKFYLFPGL